MILLIIFLTNRSVAFDQSFGFYLDKRLKFRLTIKSVTLRRNLKFCQLLESKATLHYSYKKITMSYLALTIFFYMTIILGVNSLFYTICTSLFVFMLPDIRLKEEAKSIEEKIVSELPDAFMSLKLLIGAGLTVEKSIEHLSRYEGIFYNLLEKVSKNITLGQALSPNMMNLASKCQIQSVTQFSRIIITDEKNGSLKTLELLDNLCQDLWKQKRSLYLKKGEEASTKLLIPMMISLIGVIIAVTIPAILQLFTSF